MSGVQAAPQLAENIVRFARALRAAGLKLGPRAAVDAVAAVEAVGVGNRADFYWTLHAILVNRHEDDPVFANWDQDETAVVDRYDPAAHPQGIGRQDPDPVHGLRPVGLRGRQ